jgi:hypothetical protein
VTRRARRRRYSPRPYETISHRRGDDGMLLRMTDVVLAPRRRRRLSFKRKFWIAYIVAIVAGLGAQIGRPDAQAHVPAAPPISAAWTQFHGNCSQLWSSSGCRCWEQQLQSAAITPGYAVDVLLAADADPSAQPWMVKANLVGNVPVRDAMQGCGI